MSTAYELHGEPDLDEPVLVIALEGWIDAGYGAGGAMSALLEGLDTYPIATFDADELLDHRARRPVMHLVEGVNTGLTWPGIELRGGTDLEGSDMLFLVGAEPDHCWRSFSAAVVDLASRFGTTMAVGLGAYPAAVPHTRPTLLSCTAGSEEVAERWHFLRGTLDVPAGVQAAIERDATDAGIPTIGIWAQVPHYTSAMAYPAASLALIDGLSRVGGLLLPNGDLEHESRTALARLDEIISGNEEHVRMVAALENEADSTPAPTTLPSVDELAAEVERFLRDQGREP